MKSMVRVEEVARRLGLSTAAVYHHVRRGHIPVNRVGRLLYFDWEKIIETMEGK